MNIKDEFKKRLKESEDIDSLLESAKIKEHQIKRCLFVLEYEKRKKQVVKDGCDENGNKTYQQISDYLSRKFNITISTACKYRYCQ